MFKPNHTDQKAKPATKQGGSQPDTVGQNPGETPTLQKPPTQYQTTPELPSSHVLVTSPSLEDVFAQSHRTTSPPSPDISFSPKFDEIVQSLAISSDIPKDYLKEDNIHTIFIHKILFEQGLVYMISLNIGKTLLETEHNRLKSGKFIFNQKEFVEEQASFHELMIPLVRYYYHTFMSIRLDQNWSVLKKKETNKDLIYYPILIKFHQLDLACYVGLTLLGNSTPQDASSFQGSDIFVTTLGMFGSELKGQDARGDFRPLIQYNMRFFEGEQIVSITLCAGEFYETLYWYEFEMYLCFIKNLTREGKKPTVICHVPWADYIIFGIGLYIKGHMTTNALGQFINIILANKVCYSQRFNFLALQYDVAIEMVSSLENLLDPVVFSSDQIVLPNVRADSVLKALNIKTGNLDLFVQDCLETITTNKFHPTLKELWLNNKKHVERFITQKQASQEAKAIPSSPTLTDQAKDSVAIFLQIAEAMNIAWVRTRSNEASFSVCALLPESASTMYHTFQQLFPHTLPVIGLSILDPVFCPCTLANPTGTLFYNDEFARCDLITLILSDMSPQHAACILSISPAKSETSSPTEHAVLLNSAQQETVAPLIVSNSRQNLAHRIFHQLHETMPETEKSEVKERAASLFQPPPTEPETSGQRRPPLPFFALN